MSNNLIFLVSGLVNGRGESLNVPVAANTAEHALDQTRANMPSFVPQFCFSEHALSEDLARLDRISVDSAESFLAMLMPAGGGEPLSIALAANTFEKAYELLSDKFSGYTVRSLRSHEEVRLQWNLLVAFKEDPGRL